MPLQTVRADRAGACDAGVRLDERQPQPLKLEGRGLTLDLRPYEIATLKLR